MPYYHCTKPEYAALIEAAGFTTEYPWESFRHYADEYAMLYDPQTAERIRMLHRFLDEAEDHRNAEEAARWRPELEEFWRRWIRDWGHGSTIWVASDEPKTLFGDACFEVTKPPGTVDIINDMLWWVPATPIPPKFFKRIS